MPYNNQDQAQTFVEQSLLISDAARNHLRRESWTPITAALLLSGIQPSSRWTEIPALEGPSQSSPIAHLKVFRELRAAMREPARGLDRTAVVPQSDRFDNAENILGFWDQVCASLGDYPRDVPPKDFVGWLLSNHQNGHIHLPTPVWVRVFADHFKQRNPELFVPRAALTLFDAAAANARKLVPKHKFGRYIAKAWSDGVDDPDEILARLARLMEHGELAGVELKSYSHKSNLVYLQDKKTHTLRRDTFARQLRRMKGRTLESLGQARPEAHKGKMPFIPTVQVDLSSISKLSSADQFSNLARDLLMESIQYARLSTMIRSSEGGWPLDIAPIVGNVARFSKLALSVATLSHVKQTETAFVCGCLAIETIIETKRLISGFSAEFINAYVNELAEKPEAELAWATLSLQQKAESVGLEVQRFFDLEHVHRFVHGSWIDTSCFHMKEADAGLYLPDLLGKEIHPRLLLFVGTLTMCTVEEFLRFAGSGSAFDEILDAVTDMLERLRKVDAHFADCLSESK